MTKNVITYTKDALALWNNSNGMPILAYIRTYESGEFNLLDCHEIGFTFANDLLREKKINPNTLPYAFGRKKQKTRI